MQTLAIEAPVPVRETHSFFESEAGYNAGLAMARTIATSRFCPAEIRSEVGSIMLVLDLANTMRIPALQVLTNIVVYESGDFGWKGAFLLARINASRLFDAELAFEYEGDGLMLRARAVATRKNRLLASDWVPFAHVSDAERERFPAWNQSPRLLLGYRAAAAFARQHCPGIILGLPVEGEAPVEIASPLRAGAVPVTPVLSIVRSNDATVRSNDSAGRPDETVAPATSTAAAVEPQARKKPGPKPGFKRSIRPDDSAAPLPAGPTGEVTPAPPAAASTDDIRPDPQASLLAAAGMQSLIGQPLSLDI